MRIVKLIIFVLFITFAMFCQRSSSGKIYSISELEKIRHEFNLPKEKTFILEPNFIRHLLSLDKSTNRAEINNHCQPIQASYYNKEGQLVSFHINCYAGIGVPDSAALNWNQKDAFSSFLPKTVAPLDSILTLSKHLQFLKTFDHKNIDTTGFGEYDYTIIVHFGKKWRPKDAENLINLVNQNASTAENKKINILYVNNDNNLR